jgi:trafficking protein particle complex subunit 2
MSIECVALIGENNNPLYLATYPKLDGTDLQHRFQLIIYSSLDIIDAWVKQRKSGNSDNSNVDNQFVGYLCSLEHFKVFGYVTNTSLKFLIVVSDEIDSLRLPFGSVHNFFLNFHQIYIEALYNPFYKVGAPLTSPKFAQKMSLLVSQSEKKIFTK